MCLELESPSAAWRERAHNKDLSCLDMTAAHKLSLTHLTLDLSLFDALKLSALSYFLMDPQVLKMNVLIQPTIDLSGCSVLFGFRKSNKINYISHPLSIPGISVTSTEGTVFPSL